MLKNKVLELKFIFHIMFTRKMNQSTVNNLFSTSGPTNSRGKIKKTKFMNLGLIFSCVWPFADPCITTLQTHYDNGVSAKGNHVPILKFWCMSPPTMPVSLSTWNLGVPFSAFRSNTRQSHEHKGPALFNSPCYCPTYKTGLYPLFHPQ